MGEEAEEGPSVYTWFVVVGFLCLLGFWQYRKWQEEKREEEERKARAARREKMKLEPRVWTLAEMAPYRGIDKDKPIVLCAGGIVFNVWRGWEFYCPEGPYNQLVATDASRLLAKDQLERETPEQRATPLRRYERSRLQEWIDAFDWKYERVGTLLNWNDSVLSGLPYEENPSSAQKEGTVEGSPAAVSGDNSSSSSSTHNSSDNISNSSSSSPGSSSPSSAAAASSSSSSSSPPSSEFSLDSSHRDDDEIERQRANELRMRLPGPSASS